MAAAISLRCVVSWAYWVASMMAASTALNVFGIFSANSRLAANAQQGCPGQMSFDSIQRSEEHTSELQSLAYLVCRLLLEKKKKKIKRQQKKKTNKQKSICNS